MSANQLQITSRTKTLVIFKCRSRFMARISYEEGACHDFVRQDVRRHAPPRESFQSNTLAIEANAHKQELEIDSGLQFFQR